MNAFDGLLPPRATPPPLPARGGPVAVVGAARVRRRRRMTKIAGAGGALSLAFAGFTALRPPPATHGLAAGGARHTAPPASAPVEAGVRNPHTARTPGTGSWSMPSLPASTPPPAPTSGQVSRPVRLGTPAPVVTPSAVLRGYTAIDRTVVADDPAAECTLRADDQLCFRYTGPHAASRGKPVDLSYDFCARVVDTTVTFASADEASFTLHPQNGNATPAVWHGDEAPRPDPHTVTVPRGSCLRFTAHWDGRADDGSVPPASTYYVYATMDDTRSDSAYGTSGDTSLVLT